MQRVTTNIGIKTDALAMLVRSYKTIIEENGGYFLVILSILLTFCTCIDSCIIETEIAVGFLPNSSDEILLIIPGRV